jgi:hypothetical protein
MWYRQREERYRECGRGERTLHVLYILFSPALLLLRYPIFSLSLSLSDSIVVYLNFGSSKLSLISVRVCAVAYPNRAIMFSFRDAPVVDRIVRR